jgi:hypothetical protein
MRAPLFVSVCAVVLISCGDDSTTTDVPGDSNMSDGAVAETGNAVDGGAVDATSPRDVIANADATVNPDAAASEDAAADANATPSPANGTDGNSDDTGACTDGGCPSGCIIEGSFVLPGVVNPSNACQFCDPAVTAIAWAPATTDGDGDGGFCCGGVSVPTLEGPNDCGRCGHGCGGGACSSGVCQPFVVVTLPDTLAEAYGIAVNDNLVFVSGNNSDEDQPVIYSVPLDGGAVQVFALTTDPAYELFANPSTLYWSGVQSISSDSIDAGIVTTVVARDASSMAGFGADPTGAFLYWGEVSSTNDLTVWMDSVDGGTPTVIWDGGDQPCGGIELATTAHDVYWTYGSNTSGPTVPVLTAGLGSTAVSTAASVQIPEQLAAQGNYLFMLSYSSSGPIVESVPLGEGGAPIVYADDAGPTDFAVDPSWVYIVDSANTLQAFRLDGGGGVVLDNSLEMETGFVNTPGFIYWVSSGPPLAVMGVATP